jgi:hypothetical protein
MDDDDEAKVEALERSIANQGAVIEKTLTETVKSGTGVAASVLGGPVAGLGAKVVVEVLHDWRKRMEAQSARDAVQQLADAASAPDPG